MNRIKLKYFCEVRDGTHDTPMYVDESEHSYHFVTSKDIKNGEINFNKTKFISESDYNLFQKRSNVEKFDVLMPMIGTVGNPVVVLTDIKFSIKNLALFKTNGNFLKASYLSYVLDSQLLKEQLSKQIRGGVQNFVSLSILNNIEIPISENIDLIVQFLNFKLNKIDSLINSKEKQIKLLEEQRQAMITEAITKGLNPNVKMKDSGVEWIGEIPEHWDLKKLKYISKIKTSTVNKKSTDGEKSVKLCNYTDVYYNDFVSNSIDFMQATATKEQIEKFTLKRDNVLITKDSENPNDIGIPAYVVEDFVDVVCGYHLTVLEPKKSKMLGKYLYYSIVAKNFQEQFHSKANGVTRYGLTLSSIGDSLILEPTIEEQLKIISKLDSTSSDYKFMKEKIKKQIIKLKEYRQSLIHETVTGKIPIEEMESYLKEAGNDGN